MAASTTSSLKLFYCYAREDRALRDELDLHLTGLKRQQNITSWSDREILPGREWAKEIDSQLNTADIILLLVSPHFMASNYCYGIEMERALKRHLAGISRVIPILLRPADWHEAPFSILQMLPSDTRPITRWIDRDEAFLDVTTHIRLTIRDLQSRIQERNLTQASTGIQSTPISVQGTQQGNSNQATEAHKQSNLKQGDAFRANKQFEEAVAVYDYVLLHLDPQNAAAYSNKGWALNELGRSIEALTAAELALDIDVLNIAAYKNQGWALSSLARYQEALEAYMGAIEIDPTDAEAYLAMGRVLNALGRTSEAEAAFSEYRKLTGKKR